MLEREILEKYSENVGVAVRIIRSVPVLIQNEVCCVAYTANFILNQNYAKCKPRLHCRRGLHFAYVLRHR